MPEEFGTIKPVTQMEMELFAGQVNTAENASDDHPLSYAEIQAREQAAKIALKDKLQDNDIPTWAEKFNRLLYANVPWKIAVFVAWASMPKDRRVPRTQDELARSYLGLNSDRQIAEWRKKYPMIDTMIANLQADELLEDRADVFYALKYMAKQLDYKGGKDRDTYLTMTGDLVKTSKLEAALKRNGVSADDLKGMTNAELDALAFSLKQKLEEEAKEDEEDSNTEDA
jgi:hypothetical protein